MKIAAAAVAAVLATATLAAAAPTQQRVPLSLHCHELLNGRPDAEGRVYRIEGSALVGIDATGRTLLSREGALVALGETVDRGVVTHSFASHSRVGAVVTRRVYRQVGAGPRRLSFTEHYDFARRRITSTGEPADTCHADGR